MATKKKSATKPAKSSPRKSAAKATKAAKPVAKATPKAKKSASSKATVSAPRKKTVRRTSAAKVAKRDNATMVDLRERIAVAAYYRAERRGFAPGGELGDWLEAEKAVRGS